MHINIYCGESADNGETEWQYRIDIDRRIFSVIISGSENHAEPYWVTLRERTGVHITGPSNGHNSRLEACGHGTSIIDAVMLSSRLRRPPFVSWAPSRLPIPPPAISARTRKPISDPNCRDDRGDGGGTRAFQRAIKARKVWSARR